VDRLRLGIVSFGFLGLSPIASGTAGTLGGVLLVYGLSRTQHFLLWSLVLCVLFYALGRALGEWSERHAGGKDPKFFVLDEVIGYLVTCLAPRGPSLLGLCLAFFLFRFFDVVKPPPARALERVRGGDGIMLDDVIAGLYGLLVMTLARYLLLSPDRWTV
jgi:phosphatidylglycerophosphatase A